MGRFTGQTINPNALGGKGFFSAAPVIAAAPPTGFVVQVAAGGAQGFENYSAGWDGINGTVGPGFTGTLVSGTSAAFPNGSQFGFGDADGSGGAWPGLVAPFFTVNSSLIYAQNQFTSLTINGVTYLTAAADFFSNGGGCGPTIWEWAIPAGLVAGHQYPITFA